MRANRVLPLAAVCAALLLGCASSQAASAEEYFSLGMAYFDLGQNAKDASSRAKNFTEAEKWLNRARSVDKTKAASEYNLGRIAFETKRYGEAAKQFESILKRDPENVLALKAAAYTRIKTGDIAKAEAHYRKLLELVPESADDGYNYALVLYAMEQYAEAEALLGGREFALLENSEALLLYARAQKAQHKVEAIDTYAKWLDSAATADPLARYEYAQLLETHELYARALEEYRVVLTGLAAGSAAPKKEDVRFTIAKLLLVADSASEEGVSELKTAVSDGFKDIEALETLAADERISAANKAGIRSIIDSASAAAAAAASAAADAADAAAAGADAAADAEKDAAAKDAEQAAPAESTETERTGQPSVPSAE
jgi:tetratricopeptide (TPR) repeat protein